MKRINDVLSNGELYIWIDNHGVPNIPGMKKGSRDEMRKRLPLEVKHIEESCWEFLNTESIASMVAAYQGEYGILYQWNFSAEYLKRFDFTVSSSIKYVFDAAIASEKWQFFGEVFIGIGTLEDGGHQIFWFAPQKRLPVRRFEYPAPRTVFENSIDLYEQFGGLDEWLASYEKETGFYLLEK